MSTTITTEPFPGPSSGQPGGPAHGRRGEDADERAARRAERLREQRERFQTRHSEALTRLMENRRDLRGGHALADFVDESVRWSA